MFSRRAFVLAGLAAVPALRAAADLYDDDKVSSGDIRNMDYWRTKWAMDRMEEAIKSRQPEGAVSLAVGGLMRSLEDLMKHYPMHTGIKKWYEHTQEIEKKISPNANRQESFREGCLWAEGNYEMAYASLNCARMSSEQKIWEDARDWGRMADKNLGFLEDRQKKGERTANWSPEFLTWLKDTRTQVDKLRADVKTHVR
jgi:hypothetical protein